MRKGPDKDGPQPINSAGQSHRRDSQHAQVVEHKCRVIGCGKALSRSSLWPRTQERPALKTRPVAGCRPRAAGVHQPGHGQGSARALLLRARDAESGVWPTTLSRLSPHLLSLCPATCWLTGSFQRTACRGS